MFIGIFELITIASAFLFMNYIFFFCGPFQDLEEDTEEPVWDMKAARIGSVKKSLRHLLMSRKKIQKTISLSEGSFRAGNGFMDDVYIDISGSRVSLYLNVQRDELYLSVLRGSMSIDYHTYEADAGQVIQIYSGDRVEIDDVKLIFRKRG